nr:helicase-exonuclease AddAB subunit AddA [uncultured Mediterraneibacter sp.]
MAVKWTKEQQQVIDLRDRNILVSAAAGSGKTAVLVERIISMITDEKNPVDVDKLLVVTYTEAAAAEMKERIAAAIEKKLEESPGNLNLEQQASLVHSAMITTVHKFCLSVIRDHFHVIGIDPSFRVGEEGELRLLKQDVLDEMLEEHYAKEEEEFREFVEKYGTGRTDKKIEELILQLYEYSRSYPDPGQWLISCVEDYEIDREHLEDSRMVHTVEERVRQHLGDLYGLVRQAMEICQLPAGPYMYAEALESDEKELKKLEKADSYEKMSEVLLNFNWKKLSGKKDETVDAELRKSVQAVRKQLKALIDGIQKSYFYATADEWVEDMRDSAQAMRTLTGLVQEFTERFDEKKRRRNMIDFSDMEQFALAILTRNTEGKLMPSAVAEEYQERFAEVMVDEYQDSNLVQETILTSVSGMSKGRNNMFMVGDVKQSIYRFRLSRPELFMEKYDTYSVESSSCQRIDLHKNFRSRKEVLDSTNYLFEKLMFREFGGIEYDENAALYAGAEFPPVPEETDFTDKTEVLIFDQQDMKARDAKEAEARMIARRIRELMGSGCIYDRDSDSFRKIRYKDIVILTRSIQGWAEVFSAVLAEEGIPAYSVSREGYFETYEISVLLDYLRILDNARQDLPLTAVLTSPFVGLDAEELAQIRLAYPNLPFYEAVWLCCEEKEAEAENSSGEISEAVREKLAEFMRQVRHFRSILSYTPIHDLLAKILEETGYRTFIAAMPGGEQRIANVEMLIEKACAFEGTSYKGLFNFVRYIEQLKKYNVDYGEAGIMDEQADTVRLMSIHKSKGLEFPIVFVAGMGKSFNMQDQRGSIVIHPDWGIGIDAVDLEQRTKNPTFLKRMIQERTKLENLSEELRVLYVAMTRAKEKMILTGTAKLGEEELLAVEMMEDVIKREGKQNRWKADEKDTLALYQMEGAKTCFNWILPALMREWEQAEKWIQVRLVTREELSYGAATAGQAEILAREVLEHWDTEKSYMPEWKELLSEQMNYTYPYLREEQMKLKFTVSELKKRIYTGEQLPEMQEDRGEEMYQEEEIVPLVPEFLQDQKEGLTGASRGTSYHKLMELLDFTREYTKATLEKAVKDFEKQKKMTSEMAASIRISDILLFLESGSGKRMSEAAVKGRLWREQPFVLGVDADQIYPGFSGESGSQKKEVILVQGIIDAYFEEEDGIVVLDYKTDRVKSAEQLKERYHAQLEYYAQALEGLLGKPVKEKIIYSFTLREEIRL